MKFDSFAKPASLLFVMLLAATQFSVTGFAQEESRSKIGTAITDFELKDSDQQRWRLQEQKDARLVVVAFLGTECPLVKLYAERLESMRKKFESKSVRFVGINANQQDSIAEIQHFARTYQLGFPILKDPGNRVADLFGAQRTPEIFVLDEKRRVVYHGAIDDQYTYGIQQSKAKNHYLRAALTEAIAQERITTPETDAVGCIIGRRIEADESSEVTYSNQISRLLQKNCVSCHRSGEIAPFSLTDYDEVVGWAGMIDEVIREKRMPPWHADAPKGHFKNDASLTDEELQLISRWVAAGAPEGDRRQLPQPRRFEEGWQIGKPDLILPMRKKPFRVKATGSIPYQYFHVDPGFKTDRWVKAAECRPGNRSVVHHIIVGVEGEGEFGNRRGIHGQLESEFISAMAPGSPPTIFPEGYAKRIPAGSKLIFQMHYTANGKATTDISQIGLVFAKPEEVEKRVVTLMAYNDRIRLRPGDANYRLTAFSKLDREAELMAMFPHMHFRGKSFSFEVKRPGGVYEELLNVPNYDFNWQNSYLLSKFQTLPEGSRIRCKARFDNSENNLANPNPKKFVSWGDQTWDEMMIGYFDVAIPVESAKRPNP